MANRKELVSMATVEVRGRDENGLPLFGFVYVVGPGGVGGTRVGFTTNPDLRVVEAWPTTWGPPSREELNEALAALEGEFLLHRHIGIPNASKAWKVVWAPR
jgi:hypothetical protein